MKNPNLTEDVDKRDSGALKSSANCSLVFPKQVVKFITMETAWKMVQNEQFSGARFTRCLVALSVDWMRDANSGHVH